MMDEQMPGAVASTDQFRLAPERALWEAMGCIADDEAFLRMLSAHIAAAVAAERERICAAIKAEDDYMADRDYMLDSDDCIAVARGRWKRPE